MVMLPDYPDRVISKQIKRLENISLFTSLTIILIGAWWLFNSIDSDSSAIIRFGPVIILFISAFLINDLIIFSSREKFRLGTFSNIFWPCILAFVILQIEPPINLFPNIILLIIAIFLFYFSHSIFIESIQSRRWRGISSLLGLSISISIISQSDSFNKFALVIGIQLITIIPDFLFNDDKSEERKEFSLQLKKLELRIIESQNQIFGMQQPNSLLKSAKEVGWKDPDLGLELVKDANNEISRLLYLKQDLLEIKNDTEETISRLEQLKNHPNGPREMFISGENEMNLGSFVEAELLFRKSKEKSIFLEKYWDQASRKIDEAIQLVKSDNSKSTGNLNALIEASKEAMERERPDEAIKILESLTEHLEGMNDINNEAKKSINELSNLLRASFNFSSSNLIPLREELKLVEDYLSLEKIRFENRLEINLNVSKEALSFLVPPMLIQTLVENGVKHGISKIKNGGLIDLTAKLETDFLFVTIVNDGVFNPKNIDRTGTGIVNSKKRIELLYSAESSFEIMNKNNKVHTQLKLKNLTS